MEGKFSAHGLQALDDDGDMLTAMARELVTQKGVGEKADACWREIQTQHPDCWKANGFGRPTSRQNRSRGWRHRWRRAPLQPSQKPEAD